MGFLGGPEVLVCIGVVCLIFGPSLVRGMGTRLGENVRESRKAIKEIKSAINEDP